MGRTSGTLRGLTLDGLTFDVKADADITINLSPFETEGIPSSGRSMMKMTVRNPSIEGIPLEADPVEADTLRELAERLDDFPMSIELADGSILRGTGRINFENYTTAEAIATIQLHPDRAINAWEVFAAA
jgi:hypothetical protein